MRVALLLVTIGILRTIPGNAQVRTPADSALAAAPTLAELAAATYHGFQDRDSVTLTDGRWEGAPYAAGGEARPRIILAPDFRVTGDLDGDGHDEAVVALSESSGGTGTWVYLAIMGRKNGRVTNLAIHRLGDRTQIRDARIEDGVLHVDVLRGGPGDAACCPGELASLAWVLRHGRFDSRDVSTATTRFTPYSLGGVEWVLRRWAIDEPAPTSPEATLRVDARGASGRAGCNSYSGGIGQDAAPGDIRFGPFVTTRMMCPDSAMQVEFRFLGALAEAVKVGFLTGRLAISYLKPDGSLGTLLFERRPIED